MNKKILLSLITIFAVAAVVGGMTWAQWTAETEVQGSTIMTGDADLQLSTPDWNNWYSTIDKNTPSGGEGVDLLGSEDIYPGWSIAHDVDIKNSSSSDITMALTAGLEFESTDDSADLRNVLEMKIYNDEQGVETDSKTLREWRSEEEYIGALGQDEISELMVEFSFPSDGDQDDLQNEEISDFDLVFDGVQITENVLNVNTGQENSTIEYALGNANEGDTLVVSAGTYEENVTIDVDGLTLKSASKHQAVIEGGVDVEASDVTIEGFKIISDGVAIHVDDDVVTNGLTVRNNEIISDGHGIRTHWQQFDENENIKNLEITGNKFFGGDSSDGGNQGVYLQVKLAEDTVVSDNYFDGKYNGINIGHSSAGVEDHIELERNTAVNYGGDNPIAAWVRSGIADYNVGDNDPEAHIGTY